MSAQLRSDTHMAPHSATSVLLSRSITSRTRYTHTRHLSPLACGRELIATAWTKTGSTKIWSASSFDAGASMRETSSGCGASLR